MHSHSRRSEFSDALCKVWGSLTAPTCQDHEPRKSMLTTRRSFIVAWKAEPNVFVSAKRNYPHRLIGQLSKEIFRPFHQGTLASVFELSSPPVLQQDTRNKYIAVGALDSTQVTSTALVWNKWKSPSLRRFSQNVRTLKPQPQDSDASITFGMNIFFGEEEVPSSTAAVVTMPVSCLRLQWSSTTLAKSEDFIDRLPLEALFATTSDPSTEKYQRHSHAYRGL